MKPKYNKGQKIKIVSAKNQHGNLKYPELEQHIKKTGIVLESTASLVKNLNNTDIPEACPFYKIRLDKDGTTLESVSEDALEVADK